MVTAPGVIGVAAAASYERASGLMLRRSLLVGPRRAGWFKVPDPRSGQVPRSLNEAFPESLSFRDLNPT